MRLLAFALLLLTALPAAAQWKNLQFPGDLTYVNGLRLTGTPAGIAVCGDMAGLWTYTAATETWQRVEEAQVTGIHYCNAIVQGRSAYVAAMTPAKMLLSRDGASWRVVDGPLDDPQNTLVGLAADGDDLYAIVFYRVQGEIYGRTGVFRTSLQSWGWTQIAADITEGGARTFPSLRGLAAHGGNLYAVPASQLAHLHVSRDQGKTWEEIPRPYLLYPHATAGRVLIASTAPSGFFRSRDGGATWDTLSVTLAPRRTPVRIVEAGAVLLMADQDCKLYHSADEAATWTLVVNDVACTGGNTYFDLAVSGTMAYTVDQGRAVFQADVSAVVTAAERADVPEASLSIFPHPASAEAVLHVQIDSPGMAGVEIFDLLGRRLMRQEHAVQAGASTLALPVDALAPGTYVLRLTAGSQMLTRTLVVAR